ncbi:MAG: hypothetical protein CME33_04240 [Gimesia sp.]|uniref:tetratricopeptide repeat protein n=1 Tax=Gimesia sp. TaxID=2024833 RepID=UPI000C526767|nr:hypothetical protein [Gimesia sp.]MAX35762.1 hypothetical protein [Gimesia sp.]|tara:strand:+ start:1163 stop:2149 length:987 start_codon:yes stop_codon:yes gene_type:complete
MKLSWAISICITITIQANANEPSATPDSSISDDVKQVIEVFETKREEYEKEQEENIESLKNGKPVASPNEAAAMKRYNDFYTNNPALRRFEPSSRGRIESERARARGLNAAAAKKREEQIKKIEAKSRLQSRQIFIPHYGDKEVSEFASLAYRAHLPGQNIKEKLGLESVGLYVGSFKIVKILNNNMAYAKARDEFNSYSDGVCIEGDTKNLEEGTEVFLNQSLYFIPNITEVSFQSGENSFVRNKHCLLLKPFPHKIEELTSAWELLSKGVDNQDDLDEKKAASSLRSAKLFLKVNPAKGKSRLREILKKYPESKAAKEAQKILNRL